MNIVNRTPSVLMDDLMHFFHVFITWRWTIRTFKILNRTLVNFEREYHSKLCVLLYVHSLFLKVCHVPCIQGSQNALNRNIVKHQLHKNANVSLQRHSPQNVYCAVRTESLNIIQIITVYAVTIILLAVFISPSQMYSRMTLLT